MSKPNKVGGVRTRRALVMVEERMHKTRDEADSLAKYWRDEVFPLPDYTVRVTRRVFRYGPLRGYIETQYMVRAYERKRPDVGGWIRGSR